MQKRDLQSLWRGRALALVLVAAACGQGDEDGPAEGVRSAALSRPVAAAAPSWLGETVTLISGDRVTTRMVGGKPVTEVQRGPGRKDIRISMHRRGGDTYVVPSDMEALIADGTLDEQLFNATRLLADGYGDSHDKDIPLLVADSAGAGQGQLLGQLRGQLAAAGMSVTRTMPALGVVAVRVPKGQSGAALAQLTARVGLAGGARASTKIWLDARVRPLLDHSVPQIGAPAAYARGLDGAGVKVAVIDSGVDLTHPDLIGKVALAETFVDDGLGAGDASGHGTHVASIIAGSGAASGGQLHGVAPAATLLSARVCGANGSCSFSSILAAMEWSAQQGARVVNLSLGGYDSEGIDPLEEAVNQLSESYGVLFVAAAGNSGSPNSISSPSSAAAALSVGAVDGADQLAYFSSQGPAFAEQPLKPEITAPGVAIAAARAAGTARGEPIDEHYTRLSGTSMATPHVTGSAALLAQQHPDWSGAQIKAALMGTAQPDPSRGVFEQGAGRVDLDRATGQDVVADTASLDFGLATFPHDDDPVLSRTVRYRNDRAQPVTLHLAPSVLGCDGAPAPVGMISISPATLEVPAGGVAEATVQVDTRQAPAMQYSGTVIATSGDGARVITPTTVDVEIESFDMKILPIGLGGEPTYNYVAIYKTADETSPAHEVAWFDYVRDARTYHLPKGQYLVYGSSIFEGSLIMHPRVALTSDVAVVLDAREGKLPNVTVPDAGLQLESATLDYTDYAAETGFIYSMNGGSWATAQIGPSAPAGETMTGVTVSLGNSGDDTADEPQIQYQIARMFFDLFPTGWEETFERSQFARVDASYQASPGRAAMVDTLALAPATDWIFTDPPDPDIEGRLHRTEYYCGEDYLWFRQITEYLLSSETPDDSLQMQWNEGIREYLPGTRTAERWNQAPFGPAFYRWSFFSLLPGYNSTPRISATRLRLDPALVSGTAANPTNSYSQFNSVTARLLRNGELFAEHPEYQDAAFDVEITAEKARYRLEAEVERPADLFDLSTQVKVAWSFDAQARADRLDLPLPFLSFTPALDAQNRASGPLTLLPIHIARPETAAKPAIADARIDVSFDDGATWKRLPIVRGGDRALGIVINPRRATHVSLRGTARDVNGNQVEQTIIRAYALK